MGTGRRRISLAGRGLAARVVGSRVLAPEDPVVPAALVVPVVPEDPAVRAALVVPEDPVELAVPAALVVLEDPAVRVALVVPEDPVVPAAQVVPESPAVRALAIVLAGVQEPETALVEAAPERDQVAVPLRTKSVIAVHHRGRVPLLAPVEDLAAVAEIMHAQAATEAVKAWEAAVTAVAAAPE
jgi:hypothetical protein